MTQSSSLPNALLLNRNDRIELFWGWQSFNDAAVNDQRRRCFHVDAYSFLEVLAHDAFRLPTVHTRVETIDVEPHGLRVNFKVWAGEFSLLVAKQPVGKFPELPLLTSTFCRIRG